MFRLYNRVYNIFPYNPQVDERRYIVICVRLVLSSCAIWYSATKLLVFKIHVERCYRHIYALPLASTFILKQLPVLCNLIPCHRIVSFQARLVLLTYLSCSWPLYSFYSNFRFCVIWYPAIKSLVFKIERWDLHIWAPLDLYFHFKTTSGFV